MDDLADSLYWKLLVIRCQTGDRPAFEELVARCQPRLRAFLFKMAPSRNVNDLAQEVWMDVFRDLPGLQDPGAYLPWFYRIAHNRAFRMLRQRREPDVSIDQLDPVDDSQDQTEFAPEDAQAVHAALD
jgi:RNA polymerase sigma-70 factor (ECF subfamily)